MKLSNNSLGVIIWSGNYKKLAQWYQKTIGFKVKSTQDIPGDTYVAFEIGDNYFSVGQHSEIKGNNKDPKRIMIGFNVVSVTAVFYELKPKGVKFIAEPFESPEGGYWVTTLQDPEGNVFQFFGSK